MKTIVLNKRLQAAADYVRIDSRVVDVGTDHGYLPIYLIQKKGIQHIIALDKHQGPLDNAKKNIQEYGLETRIKTVLSNGLDAVFSAVADDIIIAGLGGELMIDIIDNAIWLRDTAKRLILQPMTGSDIVRRYLYKNGFEIIEELAISDKNQVYCILCVGYTGDIKEISDCFAYLGKIPNCFENDKYLFIKKQLKRVKNMRQGAIATGNYQCEQRFLHLEKEILKYIK